MSSTEISDKKKIMRQMNHQIIIDDEKTSDLGISAIRLVLLRMRVLTLQIIRGLC